MIKEMLRPIHKSVVSMFAGTKKVNEKYPTLVKINDLIREKLKPEFIITDDGYKIYLDKKDCLRLSIHKGWANECYEGKMIKQTVKKTYSVLDILPLEELSSNI